MLEKVQADRQAKLEQLKQLGIDPYGRRFDGAELSIAILAKYEEIPEGADPSQEAKAAGRLILIRDMGKMIFAHVRDSSGKMQIAFRKDVLDETNWKIAKLLDLGDIIGVSGKLMRTRTGEITLWADELTMLCKSLLPMPEKHHGLQDIELRYRRRYLDLMTNPESLEAFKSRIAIIDLVRDTLQARGYLEVETPMMQAIYGGAAARPFTTHHNALDLDLFLRISPELYLKRLLVGGLEKVFEINRNFRNEGLSTRHNPEFTMMELYEAFADYNVMMDIAEQLFVEAAEQICRDALIARRDRRLAEIEAVKTNAERARKNKRSGKSEEEREEEYAGAMEKHQADAAAFPQSPLSTAAESCEGGDLVLPWGDELINYNRPWRRVKYAELLQEHAGVAMDDIAAVRAKAKEIGIAEEKLADAVVINEVFEETVEKHLIQPTFVCDYPADLCPLTRRDPENDEIALRFELYIAGMEVANAYTELNDPAVQEENLSGQVKGEEDETMRVMDEDFIMSLQHGMPPAGGMGIGIDRMVMLLTDTQSIRDVIFFPMLKPESTKPPVDEESAEDES